MSDKVPYAAFGNEELAAADPVGETIDPCPQCGGSHPITSSESKGTSLQFYRCGEDTYLAGLNGKSTIGIGSGGYVE